MANNSWKREKRALREQAEEKRLAEQLAMPLDLSQLRIEWNLFDEGELSVKNGTREGPVQITDLYLIEQIDGSVVLSVTLKPVTQT